VQLEAGSGGVFDVFLDNDLVFSKFRCHRFPDNGEITGKIKSLTRTPKTLNNYIND
jgi:selT/selW/selH-like putative selenoprotein